MGNVYAIWHPPTRKTAFKKDCQICGREISSRGFAWVGHGRMHVRKGDATEKIELGLWIFEPIQKQEINNSNG